MQVKLRDVLLPAIQYLRAQQLQSGDFPCVQTAGDAFYTPCTLLATLIHDSLAYLDPNCRMHEPVILDLFSADDTQWLVRVVKTLRWRLRAFVAWQEDSNGTWKLQGRQSNAGPDIATSACAATMMLRTFPPRKHFAIRHVALMKNSLHKPLTPFEKASALRFLSLAGQDVTNSTEHFREELRFLSYPEIGSDTLQFLCVAHAIARGWRQASLPGYEAVADHLLPQILVLQFADWSFGRQLETALAGCALLDLDCPVPVLRKAAAALVKFFEGSEPWNAQPYWRLQTGSAAMTMSIAVAALARIGARTGGAFY
jgi:hypothetical protein